MAPETLYTQGGYAQANPTWHGEDSPWKARQVMRILRVDPTRGPLRVCDVGCGAGGVIAALDDLLRRQGVVASFRGYDIAPAAIGRARERWKDRPNLEFACCDVLSLERLDCDVCLLMDVLEHLEDPRGFLRGLRQRGAAEYVVHLPLENNWLAIIRGKTDPRRSSVGHLHFYDTFSGISLLEQAGLTVKERVYTPEMDLDIRLHRTFPSVAAYLPRKILFRLCPSLVAHTLGGVSMMLRCVESDTNDV